MKQGLGPLSSFSRFLHYPIVMDAEPKNRSMIKQRNIWAKTRWLPWLCPAKTSWHTIAELAPSSLLHWSKCTYQCQAFFLVMQKLLRCSMIDHEPCPSVREGGHKRTHMGHVTALVFGSWGDSSHVQRFSWVKKATQHAVKLRFHINTGL